MYKEPNRIIYLDICIFPDYNHNIRIRITFKRYKNMIQEFSVENFRSIKTKQTLSFRANNKIHTGSDEYLVTEINPNVRLLKLCVLYGYNASGKSNLLLALQFLRNLVVDGPSTKNEKTGFIPFLLDATTRNEPGTFSIVFYIDSVRYEYLICLDEKRIHREALRFTPGERIATLFSRTYDAENSISKLNIGQKCSLSAKDKVILDGNTLENSSTLFAYQKSNIHSPVLDAVIAFFKKTLMPSINPNVRLRNWSMDRFASNASQKQFLVSLMEKADFQISDLEVKNTIMPVDENLLKQFTEQGAPPSFLESLQKNNQLEIKELLFTHATQTGTYQIPAEDESDGTMRFFGLGGVLQLLVSSPHFVAIDELESSLHPDLVAFYLQMFLMNSHDSQLIVTTHAQYLMEQDYVRNDMVWFCEKQENGASEYYSAQEFNLHKNNNIANFYQAGKLGAKPVLGNPLLRRIDQ